MYSPRGEGANPDPEYYHLAVAQHVMSPVGLSNYWVYSMISQDYG